MNSTRATITREPTGDGCLFRLVDLMGNPAPFRDWRNLVLERDFPAFAVLQALEQSGVAEVSSDGVIIASDVLSRLDQHRASALHLPPTGPFILEVDSKGDFSRSDMRLEAQWFDLRNIRMRDAFRSGIILNAGGQSYRLAYPSFQILEAIDHFNFRTPSLPADRLAAWADIQDMIGVDRAHARADRFLTSIRVLHATHFTIDITPDFDGHLQVSPVPLIRRQSPPMEQALFPTIEERDFDAPLNSRQRSTFQRSFALSGAAKPSYLAGDNVHVIPSPELQRSLDIVRKIQHGSPEERLAFAQAPYAHLKSEDADASETLFVESRSFSDRIRGLGEPERPVLPWQILASQGWLPPDSIILQVAGQTIKISPESIEPAIVDIESALADGRGTITVDDVEVPATELTHEAFINARSKLDHAASADTPQPHEGKKAASYGPIALLVKRNLDQTEYKVELRQRNYGSLDTPGILTSLKPHQRAAVNWLQQRWASGYNGALLADDMGLGKSATALMFMIWLRRQMLDGLQPERPMLIVAPVGLLENWQKEHDRHVGADQGFLDIVHAYGSKVPRSRKGRDIELGGPALDLERLTTDRFGKPTCVLTSYETLRDYQFSFAACHFGLVIFDEAQRLKNPASLSWSAASSLRGEFWLALTGTPVENRLADLWSILDIIEPNLLPPLKDFSAMYEAGFDETRLRELKGKLEGTEGSEPAIMLRRMKDQVLDALPTKSSSVVARIMPDLQSRAYDEVLIGARNSKDRRHILEVLGRMREISLHPNKPDELPREAFVPASARFGALFEILDHIEQLGERALIFLDRLDFQPYLAALIQERYRLQDFPLIINGEVPPTRRQALVTKFQEQRGFSAMILSPRAAGVGLTLTNANHVIHLSRWWNPAVEDQCTDRVYRIGQTKPVHVYYLQATHPQHDIASFDERLHGLLETKRMLSRELLWPGAVAEDEAASLFEG